ncbi:MAG: SDR family NAD(P)-dependent oxidoreductase [Acidimicrobiia bacterium]
MSAGKVALVTGGARGLGLEIAKGLVAHGYAVTVCARTASDLTDAEAAVPTLHCVRADVADDADRARLLEATIAAHGGLDVLVNNAAISRAHDFTDGFTLGANRSRSEIEINLVAPIELTRLFLKWRQDTGREGTPARIVMVNTPGALIPLQANPLYCTSKAGLRMFTQILRKQIASTGVGVTDIYPPGIATKLTPDIEVASHDTNGEQVLIEVGERCVEGIVRGDELVLPHPDAEGLFQVFAPHYDEAIVDGVNAGVKRSSDWNRD